MKNLPKKIYLQIDDSVDTNDFKDLSEVSWSDKKLNKRDVEYTIQKPLPTDEEIKVGWDKLKDWKHDDISKAFRLPKESK